MQFRFHFVLLLVCSIAGLAQAQNATNPLGLMGAVHDTSGAVIVGAKVTLTPGTARSSRRESSDSSGNFRFANVSAGNYTIDVTQTGFQ